MRALNLIGFLALSVAVGCGGDSSSGDDQNENEGGEGGGDAGSSSGATTGEDGGDGSGTAGSKSTGGSKSAGGTSSGTGGISSGGASMAGAPSAGGGTPTPPKGGSTGVPPMMPVGGTTSVPPEGCVQDSAYQSARDCSLGLTCTNDYVKLSCFDEGTGQWYCECYSSTRSQFFNLEGVASGEACSSAADLCLSQECSLQWQCSQPVGDGDVGVVTRQRYAACNTDLGGALLCDCSNGYPYIVEGQDGTTACLHGLSESDVRG
jgi:hypothetical protein